MVEDCVVVTEGRRYKGVDGGKAGKKANNMKECNRECFEEYDIMVWDRKESKCRCWKEGDGKWDDHSKSTAYDMRPCYSDAAAPAEPEASAPEELERADATRSGEAPAAEVPPNQFSMQQPMQGASATAGGAAVQPNQFSLAVPPNQPSPPSAAPQGSTGGVAALLASCVVRREGQSYSPRGGQDAAWFTSNSINTCVNTCFENSEIISWDTTTGACSCWQTTWGGQAVPAPGVVSFDIRACQAPDATKMVDAGATRSGGIDMPSFVQPGAQHMPLHSCSCLMLQAHE